MRKHIVAILVTGALLAAGLASTAGAPPALAADGGLRAAPTLWAQRLGADGRALQAAGRPPHCLPCMGRAAQRFYVDATHARQAIAAQQPSSLAGARARTLAIAAFADWAGAGHDLVLAVRDAQ